MTPPLPIDLAMRLGTIAIVAGLGVLGLAAPSSVLVGGLEWLAFLFFVLSGLGWLCVRVAKVIDPDLGLRATWGAALYIGVTGILIAMGVCTRPAILGVIGVGFASFAWRELVTPEPHWQRVADGLAYVRKRPAVAALVAVFIATAVFRIAGAVAQLDRNPWDDDIAYTPFVKRLLDTGNLLEPFSFRRLSAYGGQTALLALGAARGTLANVHLIDKGLFFGLSLLLVLGKARALGRVPAAWLAIIFAVLITLPDVAINTASEWTGVALILAMYRTVVRAGRSDDPHYRFALAALVGAAACTLRQNYIPVILVFLVMSLATRLYHAMRDQFFRAAWSQEWRSWRNGLVIALLALVPWWIATYRSSGTFLFPIVDGTWNHALSLKPAVYSWAQELQFLVWCAIDTTPLVVVAPLAILVALAEDDRPARSLKAMLVATIVGYVLLVHSFAGADSASLWRYAFAFGIPLTVIVALEIGNEPEINLVRLPPVGRWALLACLLLQLVVGNARLVKTATGIVHDLEEARAIDKHGDPSAVVERERYTAMQNAVPAGDRLAVMLDDPAFLDYARNPIANLDTPGFASPGSQLPSFRGPVAMRNYLVGEGYRYLAFVRPTASRYFFRRGFWLERIFTDSEIFQAMSAYQIDTIDTFEQLATQAAVVRDESGLVVLDLGTAGGETGGPGDRDVWTRKLADAEHLHDAWSLNDRSSLRIEDGFGPVVFVDDDEAAPYERVPPLRGQASRWMHRRGHLRVRGDGDMTLALRGKVNVKEVFTRPRLDVSLRGELIASVVVDEAGNFALDIKVPYAQLRGWSDVYLVWNTIGEPEKDVRDLRIARLTRIEWEP
jgi:hypothetical protein